MEKNHFDEVVEQAEYLVSHFHNAARKIECIIEKMKDDENLNYTSDIVITAQRAIMDVNFNSECGLFKNPSTDSYGTKRWINNKGELHRIDGPAVEDADGHKEWYLNGQRHRTNGPAAEDSNGDKYWYQNDKLHRLGGPAIKCTNGHKEWRINDLRHRVDGPAVEWAGGTKAWWQYGIEINPNIKINHNICQQCKSKCHDESRLINLPSNCKYELEHVILQSAFTTLQL